MCIEVVGKFTAWCPEVSRLRLRGQSHRRHQVIVRTCPKCTIAIIRVLITGEGGGPMQVEVSTLQRMVLKALADDPDARVKVAQALVEADSHARIA